MTDWLSEYLCAENTAGPSETGVGNSSSVGTVCSTDHNSESSQAWFDSEARYSGDVEVEWPI